MKKERCDLHSEECAVREAEWITVHMLPSGGKTTTLRLACLADEGCLEPHLAAGSILSGIETLHYGIRTIYTGYLESTVQQ